MENEEWCDIEGYPKYQVSNFGRIRTFKRDLKGMIRRGHITIGGYEQISLLNPKTKRGRSIKVHVLVAKAFLPNPNNYKEINHIDHNKLNNNVNNLEWCTRLYNVHHSLTINIVRRSEDLTNEEIIEIHKLAWDGKLSQEEIGNRYGVSKSTIHDIKVGIHWSSITGQVWDKQRVSQDVLSDEQVVDIYNKAIGRELSFHKIAKLYGISENTVRGIRFGYRHNTLTNHKEMTAVRKAEFDELNTLEAWI